MTQATLPCDLIWYLWITTTWSPVELQISTWLDLLFWRYCHWKFSHFAEKCLFGKIFGGFGGFYLPEILISLFWPPKECNISRNTRFETLLVKIGPTVWPLAALMNKQKKHRPLTFHPFVGVTPWTDRHAVWDNEWSPRLNHPCQILFQSVKGFLRDSTAKSVICYTFLNDPYNSSALSCRLW